MTVKQILSAKGSNVSTIEPTATLESGIAVLAERRIGALVVLGADQRVIGILSERDIVRAIAERGAGALREPLAQVMTRNVSTCTESDSVNSIMEQMTAGKFRHVPVVEEESTQVFSEETPEPAGIHALRVAATHGPLRLAILPIGAYEPRWFMQDQHMNPSDAVKALADCGASQALAHHHGTFQLTDEAIDAPPFALAAALRGAGISAERFRALRPGEVWQL